MATWWSNPEGQRRLVLDVSGRSEGLDGYDCFALDLTPELVAMLLNRINQVHAWREADKGLSFASFFDSEGEFYSRDYDSDDGQTDENDNPGPLWVREDEYDSRTEMDRLEIGVSAERGWAGWSAWVKHSDPAIQLSTETLDEADLRRFLAGEDPWLTGTNGPVGMQEE